MTARLEALEALVVVIKDLTNSFITNIQNQSDVKFVDTYNDSLAKFAALTSRMTKAESSIASLSSDLSDLETQAGETETAMASLAEGIKDVTNSVIANIEGN